MGSFSGSVTSGEEIIDKIRADIEQKNGITNFGTLILRHVSIFDSNDGDEYIIDNNVFEIRNGVFATPSDPNLISIRSIKAKQNANISIYYLR